MALQDLVLDALSEEIDSEETAGGALATLESEITAGSLFHEGNSSLARLQDLQANDFHAEASRIASLFLAWGRRDRRGRWSVSEKARSPMLVGSVIFARSADYLQSADPEERRVLLRFIKQALDNHFLETMFRDPSEQISKLQEVWGEEIVSVLARFGSVQESTAKRWLQGASPASAAFEVRYAAEILHHLDSSAGIRGEAAKEWMEEPLEDGTSAIDCICNHNTPRMVGREFTLDPLTKKLEEYEIYAFSWLSIDMARA